jgi:hypothetical protein
MVDEKEMVKALADLANQKSPNFKATAEKYAGVNRITLARRFRGERKSAELGHIEQQGNLAIAQEEDLLDWIDKLTNRKLPPSPGMVKSRVERLVGYEIGKMWVSRFFWRHRNRLQGKYLGGLDANRVYVTATAACFEIWFKNAWISYQIR